MVELNYLKELLPLLAQFNVISLKMAELEISLGKSKELIQESHTPTGSMSQAQSTSDQLINVDESILPPDLRTDNINSFDAVLNWSGSPTQDEMPMPLTGEDVP